MPSGFISQVAQSVPFDNTSTSFTADNVRDALIEVLTKANAARDSKSCMFNGTISNNQWLGYSNLIPGDQAPIVVPWTSTLRVISFSFKTSSVDGRFDLYKNGLTAGDIIHSVQFTNANGPLVDTGLAFSFLEADEIVGRWVDEGTNPNDMVITYSFELTV